MIQEGREKGWLVLPSSKLPSWAALNGISLRDVEFSTTKDKGAGVFATADLFGSEQSVITVPRELILSLEAVEQHAKSDQHLAEVLKAVGEFGRTTRGAILVFLLMQATILNPEIPNGVGLRHPLSEYTQFLPPEILPTFWSDEELDQLKGTSLASATKAKLKSLSREFEILRTATAQIGWCHQHWWESGLLTFDDWKQVDAMYRSRALEFPGIGDSMAPVIDMANHAARDATGALYETDQNGNGALLLRQGKGFKKGDEVTITYGDDKGACEMIFSYGFLEEDTSSARTIFLDLPIDDDDDLKAPKMMTSTSAPGVRLFENDNTVGWASDFIYLLIVNEEDGLHFEYKQTADGEQELQTFWKEHALLQTESLKALLQKDPLWDLFQLRAIAWIQLRIENQLQELQDAPTVIEEPEPENVRPRIKAIAARLHQLEFALLEKAYTQFEEEKMVLAESEVVQAFLGKDSGIGDLGDYENAEDCS